MKLNIVKDFRGRDILQFDDVTILYKNFSGVQTPYNREGDRNFSILIDDEEIANFLKQEGWNVKSRQSKDANGEIFYTLPIKVLYKEVSPSNIRGPQVYLERTGQNNRLEELDRDSIGILDRIEIVRVDLDVRPYDWEVNGKRGRTGYLQSMKVIKKTNRFLEDRSVDTTIDPNNIDF